MTATDSSDGCQVFVGCWVEEAGRDGFRFGNGTHHVARFGCTALDCEESGVRARQADPALVEGNTYVEVTRRRRPWLTPTWRRGHAERGARPGDSPSPPRR